MTETRAEPASDVKDLLMRAAAYALLGGRTKLTMTDLLRALGDDEAKSRLSAELGRGVLRRDDPAVEGDAG
jgi:hypothetical protein